MVDESWFSAAEAVEVGLADEIASSQTSADDNPPENLSGRSLAAHAERPAVSAPAPMATASDAPVAEHVEPAAAPEAPTAEPDPAEAEVEPAIEAPADPELAAPIDDPVPASEADDWASSTAHLTVPAPSPEDAFVRLREALL
jgi:hypothetical protein